MLNMFVCIHHAITAMLNIYHWGCWLITDCLCCFQKTVWTVNFFLSIKQWWFGKAQLCSMYHQVINSHGTDYWLYDKCSLSFMRKDFIYPGIGKSTGPRSSTGENSGGPMKTLTVPVLLSGKKIPVGSPSMGILMLKKIIGLVKVLEDQ